jgi:mRNA interferase MazF
MTTPIKIYKPFDVVVVPFPFTDRLADKRRPALVISESKTFSSISGHSLLAMITSKENASWPLDTVIENLESAGLSASSVIRLKLFTLDHDLIIKSIGILSNRDQKQFKTSFLHLLKTAVG